MSFDEQSDADKAGGQAPMAGDGGNNFLSSLLAADPADTAKVQVMNEGAHSLKDIATNGGFAINEAGAQEYIKLCDMFLDGYRQRRHDLGLLTERAKMGSSPYAYAVADFNIKVASGDEHSLIHNLDLMKDGYERLKEAFEIARKNYREADAEFDQHLGKINPA